MASSPNRFKAAADSPGLIDANRRLRDADGPHFKAGGTNAERQRNCVSRKTAALDSFSRVWCVARWEWHGLFRRPTGYLLLLVAVLVSAWSFAWLVTLIARGGGTALVQANDPIVQFLGPNIFLAGFSTLVVPLLTMSLVADERRRGTLELLLTTPLSTGEVLAGKFLASWGMLLAMLSPWVIYLLVLRFWSGATSMLWNVIPVPVGTGLPFDTGILLGGAIGLALLGGTQIAIGLLCSSGCRRPVVAALATFASLLGLLVIGVLPRVLEIWSFPRERIASIESLSPWNHLDQFSRGQFLPRVFVGHISAWVCLLWLAVRISRNADEGG